MYNELLATSEGPAVRTSGARAGDMREGSQQEAAPEVTAKPGRSQGEEHRVTPGPGLGQQGGSPPRAWRGQVAPAWEAAGEGSTAATARSPGVRWRRAGSLCRHWTQELSPCDLAPPASKQRREAPGHATPQRQSTRGLRHRWRLPERRGIKKEKSFPVLLEKHTADGPN